LPERPPLVERALALGGERACSDELGRLLHVLAGMRGRLRVAELAGDPVAAAWIVSALDPSVPFVTTAPAAGLFREDPNVRAVDPGAVAGEAPFDLVYGSAKVGLLAPRGLLVVPDEARLGFPELETARVAVRPGEALILAVRSR
jgi:hypothetical protein